MTFAQFCNAKNLRGKAAPFIELNVFCYSDILPENERDKTMKEQSQRAKCIRRIRALLRDPRIQDTTYFEKLEILSDLTCFGPADQAYIFGRVLRGAWVIVDDDTIYIIGKGKASVSAVQRTANNMKQIFREMRLNYSWWPCYGM